jgi:hypothetical protein
MYRQNFSRRALANIAASQTRAQGAALKRGFLEFLSSAGHGRRTGVGSRQRGKKMAAADRFGLRFSLANACKPASGWGQKAKTLAKNGAIRLDRIQPNLRINSCGIVSRVETVIPRRVCARPLTISVRSEYHYCSINAERRNSENCWSFCGNPATSISADFRIPLINKHLDLFQNGPPLANCVSPARVLTYWCPET